MESVELVFDESCLRDCLCVCIGLYLLFVICFMIRGVCYFWVLDWVVLGMLVLRWCR